jgi:CubicO group peptidase (beta-lactamase class C family)
MRYAHSDEVRSLRLLWEPGSGIIPAARGEREDAATRETPCQANNFRYSNIAFDVLGAAFENITGKSFEALMADFFFEPLGMKDSTFLTPLREYGGHRLVKPHYRDAEKHIRVQPYYPYNRAHAPSSTLTSTLRDLKKWGDEAISRMHDSTGLLRFARNDEGEALRPHADIPGGNEQIGLAWFIREQNGYTLYGHEGADDGFRSSFWICPELSLQITVLANQDRAPVKKISRRVFDIITAPS